MERWRGLHAQLNKARPPIKLLSELDKASSLIRDILNTSFNAIHVDTKELYHNIKDYLAANLPEKAGIIQLHQGNRHVFDLLGVKRQIKSSFGHTSTLTSGAYIVIERTEAMHVIDVNSGPKVQKMDQENASLQVNLEAAEEIARQIRLRDIGGLIVIDFIDLKNTDNKLMLYQSMKEFMAGDRSQHTILPLSKFGLMQITRQRARQEMTIDSSETCPSCKGTGKINPSILLIDTIENQLEFILKTKPIGSITLEAHPFVISYLRKGFFNYTWKWYFRFHKRIHLRENQDIGLINYKFFDGNEEIRMSE
jgi:ribonuclease G